MARPTKYTEELLTKTMGYIAQCNDVYVEGKLYTTKIPTIEGLAVYLEINKDTIYDWCKGNKEFSDVIDDIRNEQADRLINNGLAGRYNPTITKVLLTKHGYREGVDATTNDKDLPPLYLPTELIKKNNLDGSTSSTEPNS